MEQEKYPKQMQNKYKININNAIYIYLNKYT